MGRKRAIGRATLCYLCKVAPATTRDHVPPKGFIPLGLRKGLITLPACQACNKALSADEEFARDFLAVGPSSSAEAIFREKVVPSMAPWREIEGGVKVPLSETEVRIRLAKYRDFKSRVSERPVYTPSGVFIGRRPVVTIPSDETTRIDAVVVKVAKGLAAYEGFQVGAERETHVFSHLNNAALREWFPLIVHEPTRRHRAWGDAFKYWGIVKYGPEGQQAQAWALLFHNQHAFIVVIT